MSRQTRKEFFLNAGANVLSTVNHAAAYGMAMFLTSLTWYELSKSSDVDKHDSNVSNAARNAVTAVVGVASVLIAAGEEKAVSERLARSTKGSVLSLTHAGWARPRRGPEEQQLLSTTPGMSHGDGDG